MNKEFIPYELALEMKLIGFDEPCFGATFTFNNKTDNYITFCGQSNYTGYKNSEGEQVKNFLENEYYISHPTFSQCFRWFREKYNLHSEPYTVDMGAIEYCFQIRDLYSEKYVYDNFVAGGSSYGGTFSTPEQAEIECLKKLIQIIKEQK